MKLDTWLSDNGVTRVSFARSIGVNPSTVTRLISGERKPAGSLMAAIHHETDGQVTVSDFFDPRCPTDARVAEKPRRVESNERENRNETP